MRMDLDEPPYIDVESGYDCRLCIPACPFEAIALRPLDMVLYEVECDERERIRYGNKSGRPGQYERCSACV